MGQEEEEGRGEDYEDNDEAQYGSASPHDNLGRCQEKSLLHNRVTFFLRFAIFFLNLLLHPVVVFYESFACLLRPFSNLLRPPERSRLQLGE